jgi:hypothetical protein
MAPGASFPYVHPMVFTISGVEVAERFLERWRGLRPRPDGRSMIVPGASVHAFGMKDPVWAVGLDASDLVIDVRFLRPGTVVWIRGAKKVLEIPASARPPEVGDVVVVR